MPKTTQEESPIIVGEHILHAASSTSINTLSYEPPRLALTSNLTSLISASLKLSQRASLYTSCPPLVRERSHER